MSLFNSISPLIRICSCIGLAPYSIDQNTLRSSSVFKLLSNTFAIVIFLMIFIVIIFNKIFIDHTRPTLNIVLLNTFMFLNHLHALVSLLESGIKCEKQIDLLNKFKNLDILAKQKLEMHIDYSKLKIVCWQFIFMWIYQVSAFVISITFLKVQFEANRPVYYALIFLPLCVN